MRILVVDDERIFDHYKIWGMQYPKEDNLPQFTYAETGETALVMLTVLDSRFDIVYLDHDLGKGIDGYGMCLELEKNAWGGKLANVGKFIIHSMNPIGRMNMYNALHKFYNVEFARVEDLM